MSLLRQIQEDAMSASTDVATILRRSKVLGARLQSREFETWVSFESNGYPKGVSLPPYRMLSTRLMGTISLGNGSWLNHAPIPLSNIPADLWTVCSQVPSLHSVSSIAELLSGDDPTFKVVLSSDTVKRFSDNVYVGGVCLEAWREVTRMQLHEILNTVRNRILDFTIEIEKLNPEAGDAPIGKPSLPSSVVSHTVQTIVLGNLYYVGTDNSTTISLSIAKGDVESLKAALASVGLSKDEIITAAEIVRVEPPANGTELGPRAKKWAAELSKKAASSGMKIAVDVATQFATTALKQFLGIPV